MSEGTLVRSLQSGADVTELWMVCAGSRRPGAVGRTEGAATSPTTRRLRTLHPTGVVRVSSHFNYIHYSVFPHNYIHYSVFQLHSLLGLYVHRSQSHTYSCALAWCVCSHPPATLQYKIAGEMAGRKSPKSLCYLSLFPGLPAHVLEPPPLSLSLSLNALPRLQVLLPRFRPHAWPALRSLTW